MPFNLPKFLSPIVSPCGKSDEQRHCPFTSQKLCYLALKVWTEWTYFLSIYGNMLHGTLFRYSSNIGCGYFSDPTKRTGPDWRYKIRTGPDCACVIGCKLFSLALTWRCEHVLKMCAWCWALSLVSYGRWGCMRNSFLRQTRIFTPEEASEIVLIIVLYSYINFDLCILLQLLVYLWMIALWSL